MRHEAGPPRLVYALDGGKVQEWVGREHPSGVWYLERNDPRNGLTVSTYGPLDVYFSPVIAHQVGRDIADLEV
jgi:hypothetical protein